MNRLLPQFLAMCIVSLGSTRLAVGDGTNPTNTTEATARSRGGVGFFGGGTAEEVASRHSEVFRRGYALVVFNPNDVPYAATRR